MDYFFKCKLYHSRIEVLQNCSAIFCVGFSHERESEGIEIFFFTQNFILSHPTMTMAAASTAAMNSAMNYPQFQMASQPQQQPQQVAPLQIQPPSNEHFLNGEAAMSPSRSVFFYN